MVSKGSGADPAGVAGRGGAALHVVVEEELEAIFAALPSGGDPDSPHSPVTPVTPRKPTFAGVSRWGAVAAGLLLVAAAGAGFVKREPPPAQSAPRPELVSADLVAQPMPEPLVLARQAEPVAPTKAVLRPAAQPRPKAKPRPAARRQAGEAPDACGRYQGEALARCLWPTVMQADQELRRAYERAARDGVARRTMVSYRERWSDLRHDARRRPEKVISAYRRMAADLDGARSRVADG